MAWVLMLAPAFYAQGNYKTPSFAASLSVLVNMGLNALLVFGLELGATSIAIATSAAAFINCFWLLTKLKTLTKEPSHLFQKSIGTLSRLSLSAFLAAFFTIALKVYFSYEVTSYAILLGKIPNYSEKSLHTLFQLGIEGSFFLLCFFFFTFLFQRSDLLISVQRLRN